jgi:hypothetical protein
MKKKIFLLVLFISSLMSTVFAANEIDVKVSKTKIGINESLSVVFSSQQKINGQPDFTPLEADFEILSNSQSHQTTMINGKFNQEIKWSLVLMPKHEGELILPPISFGNLSSSPITIEVTQAQSSKKDESLFLETELSPSDAIYVQTQLVYTIRLYTSVNLSQATLSELKVNDPDTIIEKLGSDTEYEHHHANGKRYHVFERKYLVFPQHPGELIFSPIVFSGQVLLRRNSFFDYQTEYTRASSDQIKVDVKPIPAPFHSNNWFAAQDVILKEEWSADPNAITLGEPITWTLTLIAEGCLGNHIPNISLTLPSDLKHYFDKPQVENQSTPNGNRGTKQIKVAVIATKPGEIILPAINIDWWDLKTNQVRQAQLPERIIQVQGGPIAMNTLQIDQLSLPTPIQEGNPQKSEENTKSYQDLPLWAWSLIGLNAVWLVLLVAFLAKKRVSSPSKESDSLRQIKQKLKTACQANDSKQAETFLLAWAKQFFPQQKPLNIAGIKQYVSEEFQQAIEELYQALYGQKSDWQGDSLWKAVVNFRPQISSKMKNQPELLRELYPSQ